MAAVRAGEFEPIADVLSTASGSDLMGPQTGTELVTGVCERCGLDFKYEREWVRFGPHAERHRIDRERCDDCQEQWLWEQADAADLEERQRLFDLGMSRSGRGDQGTRLAKATFDTFIAGPHNAPALARAQAWVKEEAPPNLVIVGPVGSGKSYLAACVYNALLADLRPAYWLNAGSLMSRIRRGFSDRETAAEANGQIEVAGQAPVLVLDDLGKVHPGKDVSWVEETFYAIIEERYRNERPTIVTTEWRGPALAERVGESVKSRIQHDAWVVGVNQPVTAYRQPTPATPAPTTLHDTAQNRALR